MKLIKRKLLFFLACLLMAGVISSCSGGKNPEDVKKIKIWHTADATIADTLQEQLNSLAPDVEVTMERKDQIIEALQLIGNDPFNAPDMYFWAHDKVGVFAAMDILAPVNEIIDTSELSDMLPMSVLAGTYEEKLYQLPVYFETLLFMYNKSLMANAPAATDELLAEMKSKTTDDMYVFAEQHSTAYFAACWIQGYDGFIIDSRRQPGLNNPGTVEGLRYHKEFMPYMPPDGEYNTITSNSISYTC